VTDYKGIKIPSIFKRFVFFEAYSIFWAICLKLNPLVCRYMQSVAGPGFDLTEGVDFVNGRGVENH